MTGLVVDGLVVIDKPAGWTSHDVVARCRKVFGQQQVGHGGTLDPDATGVLLVGLGRATRLLQFVVGLPKAYTGEVVLGVSTATLDAAGEVTGRWDMTAVTVAQARAAAEALTGPILQVPPMVSAIQIGGKRLHRLAREGVEVEREPRRVVVTRFEVTHFDASLDDVSGGGPILTVEVDCSSGTYVRSLAADLGTALGGGAHLRNLRRTAVGEWTVSDATPLDGLADDRVLPPAAAVRGLPQLSAPSALVTAIGHGRVLGRSELGAKGDGPWAVIGPGGDLLAVYQSHGEGRIKPVVVLATLSGRPAVSGGPTVPLPPDAR